MRHLPLAIALSIVATPAIADTTLSLEQLHVVGSATCASNYHGIECTNIADTQKLHIRQTSDYLADTKWKSGLGVYVNESSSKAITVVTTGLSLTIQYDLTETLSAYLESDRSISGSEKHGELKAHYVDQQSYTAGLLFHLPNGLGVGMGASLVKNAGLHNTASGTAISTSISYTF